MNFPSHNFLKVFDHSYRTTILKKFVVAACVLNDFGYFLLLWKDVQNNAQWNCVVLPYIDLQSSLHQKSKNPENLKWRIFKIYNKRNCKSNYLIYLMKFVLCNKNYTGKSEAILKLRLNNHWKDVNKQNSKLANTFDYLVTTSTDMQDLN